MTPVEEQSDEDLKVTQPKECATGVPAVAHAMQYSLSRHRVASLRSHR
jgi:hypothetical protein